MNNFYKQIWIAFKVWLIAVSIDTVIGTLLLAAGFGGDGHTVLYYVGIYSSLSAIFSFPIFLTLVFILNRCHARNVASDRAYLIVLLAGVGLTILMFAIFLAIMGGVDKVLLGHFVIALLSAFAAVYFQHASILRIVDAN